jgi:pyridoxine 5'-phosphate synthase PdxJ
MSQKKVVSSNHVTFHIDDDILYAKYKEGITLNRKDAEEIVNFRVAYCENIDYPTIVITPKNITLKPEARDYFNSPAGYACISKLAILIDGELTRIVGNWFIRFGKHSHNTKLFTNQNEAIKWLKE